MFFKNTFSYINTKRQLHDSHKVTDAHRVVHCPLLIQSLETKSYSTKNAKTHNTPTYLRDNSLFGYLLTDSFHLLIFSPKCRSTPVLQGLQSLVVYQAQTCCTIWVYTTLHNWLFIRCSLLDLSLRLCYDVHVGMIWYIHWCDVIFVFVWFDDYSLVNMIYTDMMWCLCWYDIVFTLAYYKAYIDMICYYIFIR